LKEKSPFNIEVDIDYQLVEDNEEQNENTVLSKLEGNDETNKIKLRRQGGNANVLSRASSAASNINVDSESYNNMFLRESAAASPSQSFLPKIDSRFLPNNTK
jgi:hypothetical protein